MIPADILRHMARTAPGKHTFLTIPASSATALAVLTEPIRSWFSQHFPQPTPAQCLAWPAVARGDNFLLSSPTGTGKTLAALLPVFSQLCLEPSSRSLRCLYVSPLKALCNDLHKSISHFVGELKCCCDEIPPLRAALRTGDTKAPARKKIILDPPTVLLTTPESLALMLTHSHAARFFAGLRWVVVDEVHALAGNKRGADLSLSLERLEELAAGPLQRIGLSATCSPLETAAHFLVGGERDCTVAEVVDRNSLEVRVESLQLAEEDSLHPQRFFRRLVDDLDEEMHTNHSILVFCNTRRRAERLALALRRRYPEWTERIAIHHSSLCQKRRNEVEEKLKQGLLKIVVSSSSLELGIDIGSVDLVVLIHPPGGVTRFLQRIGRSGHRPGQLRRGLIFTGKTSALLEAIVTCSAGRAGQLELLHVAVHPLDVLCQQLLGMAAQRNWTAEEAFDVIRRAYPYSNLSWQDFRHCLDYLSGANHLPRHLRWEGNRFRIAGPATLRLLRQNIGSILSQETIPVRTVDRIRIGELDPSFADRLLPGDRFVLEGRCWQLKNMTPQSLIVEEATGRPVLPHWSGERQPLARELAQRLYVFRTLAAEALLQGKTALVTLLQEEYALSEENLSLLVEFLQQQEALSEIPAQGMCLIESVFDGEDTSYFVHTSLSRAGNDALARIVAYRASAAGWIAEAVVAADLGFVFRVAEPWEVTAEKWRLLLSPDLFLEHLAKAIADCSALRGRFTQVAHVGMLLTKPSRHQHRTGRHDWVQRRLLECIQTSNDDFVLLRQARRELMEHCFDAESALGYLKELRASAIHVRQLPCISPFAEAWTQIGGSSESIVSNAHEARVSSPHVEV